MTREERIAILKDIIDGEIIHPQVRKDVGTWAIEALEQEPEWIPVSERLPENDTIVLVTFASGMVSMSSWHENTQYNNGFDNMGHGITEDGTVLNYGTVAWMPLPEPYKTESEVQE